MSDVEPPEEPVLSAPGEGERFVRDNRTVTIKVDLPELSVLEIEFDDTFEVPPHTHDDQIDGFYVITGDVEFVSGEEIVTGGPGTVFVAPRGARHGFRNAGSSRAKVLNFHVPDAGFAERIRSG